MHSEAERRGQYFGQLERILPDGGNHPFLHLMKQCLRNAPSQRPNAEEMIASLEGMKADIEGPYGDVARADAVTQVVMILRKRELEVKKNANELTAKNVEIDQLQPIRLNG